MAVPNKRGPLLLVMIVLTFSAIGVSARADEIRLKGGKKLYGVIVAYEDNMFKVKTDYFFNASNFSPLICPSCSTRPVTRIKRVSNTRPPYRS